MIDFSKSFFLANGMKVISSDNLTTVEWLFTSKSNAFGLVPGYAYPTGVFLLIILSTMYIFSIRYVRKGGYFEVVFI